MLCDSTIFSHAGPTILLLAQGDRNYGISWAIVLLCVVVGLIVTLRPSRRTSDIKKPH